MAESVDLSIVRVYSNRDSVIGAAFLVEDRRILTCAHVVQQALGIVDQRKTDLPAELVNVDFPLSKEKELCSAHVIAWDLEKDIAVLIADGLPVDAVAAGLSSYDKARYVNFRSFGFPVDFDAGVWATGVIRGINADGWLQLEDVKAQGYQIEPGFSGGPIWDDQAQAVVGMVVASDTQQQRKAAFGISAEDLRLVLRKSGGIPQSENPYRGLEPFESDHADYFFGRTRMIDSLADKVLARNFVAVVGPSGSGKSSLIRAGLLPRLKGEYEGNTVVITPTKNPIDRLILSLLDWQGIQGLGDRLIEAKKIADLLQQDAVTLQRFFLQVKGPSKLLLVVDQFEELFTHVPDDKTHRLFIDSLIAISAEDFAKVVIAIRADFYGHLLADPALGPVVNEGQHNVLPLSKDELREVIEQPALKLGRRFDAGLVEIILQETLGQPGYLPLLEFALTQLWDKQTASGALTVQAYDEIGRVAGAMAKAAEQVVSKYEKQNQTSLVRQVFVRLVQPGLNAPDTRRRATKDEFSPQESEEIWKVVKDLADARLVVTSFDDTTHDETIEVSHEALIQGWARLGEWVEADREFLTWRQTQLDPEIQKWEKSHHSSETLLRGEELVIAKRWLRERTNDIGEEERAYIFQSILHDGKDLQTWMPLFSPFEEVFAKLERYLASENEKEVSMGLEAMQWLVASEPDAEARISNRLIDLILTHPSREIQEQATFVLCQRKQFARLAARLQADLEKEKRTRVIQALGYARNLPKLGKEIDRLVRKDRRAVQRESVLQLIIAYRNEFAISLLMAFLFGQITSILTSPVVSILSALINNSRNRYDIFPVEIVRIGQLNIGYFDVIWLLGTLYYFYISRTVINGEVLDRKMRLRIGIVTFLVLNLFQFLFELAYSLIQLDFFSGPELFVNSMLMTLNFFSGLIYLLTIATSVKFDRIQGSLLPVVFRISAKGYLRAFILSIIIPATVLFFFPLRQSRFLGVISAVSWGSLMSISSFLTTTMGLYGFYFGLQTILPGKFSVEEEQTASFSFRNIRRPMIAFFTIVVIGSLLWQVTISNPILPSVWCSITTGGNKSSGLIISSSDYLRSEPTSFSSGFQDLRWGSCVQALGRYRGDPGFIYIDYGGVKGWVRARDGIWFNEVDIPDVDLNGE